MARSTVANNTVSGSVVKRTVLDRFISQLDVESTVAETEVDSALITEQVTEKMFAAGSLEDAIAVQDSGLPSAKDMVGVEHTVLGFEVVKSTKPDAILGHYLRVSAASLTDGTEFTYSVGAPNPVSLLWKARETGRLPLDIRYEAKTTGSGNDMLLLRLVPARAVRS
jgi:hypothetical protein